MGETFKTICAFILIVASIAACLAWADDANQTTWIIRCVSTMAIIGSLGGIIWALARRDKETDYLYESTGNYFNRDGFCFSLRASSVGGVCQFRLYFQNQYDEPCIGRVAIRAATSRLSKKTKLESVRFEIHCEPAAYGVATIPIALPRYFQGRSQRFEVGASVEYPQGNGNRLRFRDGIFVRENEKFQNAFMKAATVIGALGGEFILHRPPSFMIELPLNVTTEPPRNSLAMIKTLWKLGDDPISVRIV